MTDATLPEAVNDLIQNLNRVKSLLSLSLEMYQAMSKAKLETQLLGRYMALIYGERS